MTLRSVTNDLKDGTDRSSMINQKIMFCCMKRNKNGRGELDIRLV